MAGKEQNHHSLWHLRIVASVSVLSTMQEQEGKDKNHWYQRIFLVIKAALLSLVKELKVGLIHLDSSMISIPVVSMDFFQLIHFLPAGRMLVCLPGVPKHLTAVSGIRDSFIRDTRGWISNSSKIPAQLHCNILWNHLHKDRTKKDIRWLHRQSLTSKIKAHLRGYFS